MCVCATILIDIANYNQPAGSKTKAGGLRQTNSIHEMTQPPAGTGTND